MAFFVHGKMPNAPEQPIPPFIHYITLNLNILTSRQNIKNLVGNFEGIHLRIMHAKFQASKSPGVEGECSDRHQEGRIKCSYHDP